MQKELELTVGFKDHFSTRSDGYAKYRPTYPPDLFRFLASTTECHDRALDCATGNGQAAVALAEHFSEVIAIDASQAQLDEAMQHPGVRYQVAAAEHSGIADHSIDLVTVAQAFHWFDEAAFMAEASRVLRPNGVLALWCYELCRVNEACDSIVDHLYVDIVGEYWLPERALIEEGYAGVAMPGTVLEVPQIQMSLEWTATDMLGYLRTWSATKRYEKALGRDPVALIETALREAWGESPRTARWPLEIKVSRMQTLLE